MIDSCKLLLNPTKQDEDAIKGLDRICTVLLQYRVIEKTYFMDDGTRKKSQVDGDLYSHFQNNTIKLYRQILGYQFRLATHYCRKIGSKYLRDVFLKDNWKDLLDEINTIVADGDNDRQVFFNLP